MIISENFIKSLYEGYNDEETTFLLITSLHFNGIINDMALKNLLKNLRNKTLIRRINTYHFRHTNTWYNDEDFLFILYNEYTKIKNKKILTYKELIFYIKILIPDFEWRYYFLDKIIKPLLKTYLTHHLKYLETDLPEQISFSEADAKYDLGSGYCCEDCDGRYSEYKSDRYEYYRIPMREYEEHFKKLIYECHKK